MFKVLRAFALAVVFVGAAFAGVLPPGTLLLQNQSVYSSDGKFMNSTKTPTSVWNALKN